MFDSEYNGKCCYYYHVKNGETQKRVAFLNALKTGILIRSPQAYTILERIAKLKVNTIQMKNTTFLLW